MEFGYIKALHIIFVVTWFAGLFYIVRLFIYFVEAAKEEGVAKAILQEQYQLMSKRLWYGITWPSAILTAFFATWLFSTNFSYYISQPWMHIKLTFVVALYVYHFMCHRMFVQLMNDKLTFCSTSFAAVASSHAPILMQINPPWQKLLSRLQLVPKTQCGKTMTGQQRAREATLDERRIAGCM